MKKKALILVALGFVALATLGCSVCSSITEQLGGGSEGSVTMINSSDQTICYVYISPTEDEYWGDDWLDSSETIGPGQTRTFSVDNGTYDLGAFDCDDNAIDTEWEVNISGPYTWTVR
jgi:hypothetical protein